VKSKLFKSVFFNKEAVRNHLHSTTICSKHQEKILTNKQS